MQLAKDIEQELDTIREESKACSKVTLDAIYGLHKKLESFQPTVPQSKPPPTTQPPLYQPSSSKLPPPPSTQPPPPSTQPPQPSSRPKPPPPPNQPKPNTEYQSKTKVLYVCDSVGRGVEFPRIEKELECTIRTAKAYSSVEDNRALWPASNFADVVKVELAKNPIDCLVMTAPTVDITNIDASKLTQSDSTDIYQQMVYVSCSNMFTTATNTLKENPKLKKVIIFEHSPRNDTDEVDPLKMKPALARYANNVFTQLWLNCPQKNRITIGQHSLVTNGSDVTHNDLYKNNKYDGVHHYGAGGRRMYTKSVMNILKKVLKHQQSQNPPQDTQKAHQWSTTNNQGYENSPQEHQKKSTTQSFHQQCPQTLYQQKHKNPVKTNNDRYHASVQDNNRFSVFNTNLGNC